MKKIILITTRQHLFDTHMDMIQYQTLNERVWRLLEEFSLYANPYVGVLTGKKKIQAMPNSPSEVHGTYRF